MEESGMTGIFLLGVTALWLVSSIFITIFLTRKLPKRGTTYAIQVLLFIALLTVPVIDEIIAKPKFEALCREKAAIIVDAPNTKGRAVWFGESQRTQIELGTIQVTLAKRNYVDAKTQDAIYHYYRLEAKGGWLIRALEISEGDSPLLFNGICQPKNIETIDAQLGLLRINRPTSD